MNNARKEETEREERKKGKQIVGEISGGKWRGRRRSGKGHWGKRKRKKWIIRKKENWKDDRMKEESAIYNRDEEEEREWNIREEKM
jgi:hypothetical protein